MLNKKQQLSDINALLHSNVITQEEHDDLIRFLSENSQLDQSSDKKEDSANKVEMKVAKVPNESAFQEEQNSSKKPTETFKKNESALDTKTSKEASGSKSLVIIVVVVIVVLLSAGTVYYFHSEKKKAEALLIEQSNKIKSDSIAYVLKARQDSIASAEAEAAKKAEMEFAEANKKAEINKIALNLIQSYYTSLIQDNFDANDWFEPNVQAYLSKTNITSDDINIMHSENTEFTNRNITIKEESVTLDRTEGDVNYFQYECHFTCFRTSKNKYQACDILVEIGINTISNKFVSYRELKITNLNFTNDQP